MAISERVKRLLLSRSAGYCMNPECSADLFRLFESGEISSVEELAHVIAAKDDGPRGDGDLAVDQRDEYQNIIVLCPTCHTVVDKNPKQYPAELLRKWKRQRETTLERCFRCPKLASRAELAARAQDLLRRNKAIFDTYGPFSDTRDDPLTDAVDAWRRHVRTDIIPNNRQLFELLFVNREFLAAAELDIMEKFRVHKEALEYNYLTNDRNARAPIFPSEMTHFMDKG